ncbi:cupredoxin family protein [Acidovorax sp.]|uniref:cupredoxin domain-containing protein n=1 Tax=Acidovorax sp. TaxID=1872122 RepID=UPI002635C2EF|nr:cupredoxin family protein [Acidovorax sp.]
MKTIKFIAASALWISASTSFGHEGATHTASSAPVVKEQKTWGIAGDAKAVGRTITIRMTDNMRFTPSHIEVREGETVRLRAENKGQVLHEIVLGTQADLDAHAAMMAKHPGMEHDEPHMAHVGAGKKGDIVWTFNRPGQFDFACLIAGHYQAGMTGTITVLPRKH